MDKIKQKADLAMLTLTLGVLVYFFACWIVTKDLTMDDYWYKTVPFNMEWFGQRWETWSQRIAIDAFVVWLTRTSELSCEVITILIWIALAVSLLWSLRIKNLSAGIAVVLTLTFQNVFEVETAGYFTTHLNYVLPVLLAILVCNILYLQKINGLVALLMFCMVYILGNQELAAIGMIPILGWIFFKGPKQNRSYVVACFLITLLCIALFFMCGATTVRKCVHGLQEYPNFESLSVLYKIYSGSLVTLTYYFCQINYFSIFLISTLTFCLLKQQNKLTWINAVITVVIAYLCHYVASQFNEELIYTNLHYQYANNIHFTGLRPVLLYLYTLLCVIAVIIEICTLSVKNQVKLLLLGLLGVGFAVRMVMAFSPTIFFSLSRTFIFFNFAILLCALFALKQYQLLNSKKVHLTIIVLAVLALIPRFDFLKSDDYKDHFPYYPFFERHFDMMVYKCQLKYNIRKSHIADLDNAYYKDFKNLNKQLRKLDERNKRLIEGNFPAPVFQHPLHDRSRRNEPIIVPDSKIVVKSTLTDIKN